jgi:hypothetical protein
MVRNFEPVAVQGRPASGRAEPFPPRAGRLKQSDPTVPRGQIPGYTARGAVNTLGGNGFAQRGQGRPSKATAKEWLAAVDRTVPHGQRQGLMTSSRSKRSDPTVPRGGRPAFTTPRARWSLSDPRLRTPCPDVKPELGPCCSVRSEGTSARAWHNDRSARTRTAGPRGLRVGVLKTIGPNLPDPDRFTSHAGP